MEFHKKTVLYVRIDESLMEEIRTLARDNDRTLNSTVTIILQKGLGKDNMPLFRYVEEP